SRLFILNDQSEVSSRHDNPHYRCCGISMRTTVPWLLILSRLKRPPCSDSTILMARGRPNPVPFGLLVAKRAAASPSGSVLLPHPESSIEISTRPSSAVARTTIGFKRPLPSYDSTAFSSTLVMAWTKRARETSAVTVVSTWTSIGGWVLLCSASQTNEAA